ncbi:hypothetical protein [Bacillus sp. FSL R10-2780]|uniref:hypothetical protein n=1 Tax=Bacillus sp. FSL R10-2780 TaxID=2954660 RepID=UPI0030F83118
MSKIDYLKQQYDTQKIVEVGKDKIQGDLFLVEQKDKILLVGIGEEKIDGKYIVYEKATTLSVQDSFNAVKDIITMYQNILSKNQ